MTPIGSSNWVAKAWIAQLFAFVPGVSFYPLMVGPLRAWQPESGPGPGPDVAPLAVPSFPRGGES